MATAVHNNAQNMTTKQVPNIVLLGFSPMLAPLTRHTLGVLAADDQITQMTQAQNTAIDVIN